MKDSDWLHSRNRSPSSQGRSSCRQDGSAGSATCWCPSQRSPASGWRAQPTGPRTDRIRSGDPGIPAPISRSIQLRAARKGRIALSSRLRQPRSGRRAGGARPHRRDRDGIDRRPSGASVEGGRRDLRDRRRRHLLHGESIDRARGPRRRGCLRVLRAPDHPVIGCAPGPGPGQPSGLPALAFRWFVPPQRPETSCGT